ncbi:MAG: transglycosylase SLT domain-containing protein [Chloroflexaceae bacterium]|nr:transglycosylase SLT domain-containing protein [Chloroflexaceae bacterium]
MDWRACRLMVVVGCILCLLNSQTFTHHSAAQPAQPQAPLGCSPIEPKPPEQNDRNAHARDPDTRPGNPPYNQRGERSLASKDELFQEIAANGGTLGDFDWRIVDQNGTRGNFLPARMLRSVGGIESIWRQYEPVAGDSVTLETNGDYGLMQINRGTQDGPNPLFGFTSSSTVNTNLCNDTRANIAAGATRLANLWEEGRTADLPVVNDQNPRFVINWYYALSSYNGGPANRISDPPVGRWPNNPNCDGSLTLAYCDGFPDDPNNFIPDYTDSRDPGANWYNLAPGDYPYQERVLYNVQFPRQPTATQWTGQDIGLRATRVSARETGIIPVDSLFEGFNEQTLERFSRAPNLLLFRTNIGIVNQEQFPAIITIAYDLPLEAAVTIEIIDANNQFVATLLNNEQRQAVPGAALNVEQFSYSDTIEPEYGYRIRVQNPDFEGEYIRPLRIVGDGFEPPYIVFLPLVHR